MMHAEKLADAKGQELVVMTCDQQIYSVCLQIVWDNPKNFFIRLGGMHLLMGFVGSIGALMADSGFEDIVREAFTGEKRIMIGKKFPECVKAFRMIAVELLKTSFQST